MAKSKIKNMSDIQRAFNSVYYSKIAPRLEEWEYKRRKKLLLFFVVVIATISSLWAGVYFSQNSDFETLIFAVTLILCILGFWAIWRICSDFTSDLKMACLRPVVKAFGDMKWQNGKTILSSDVLQSSELFSDFNQRADDDIFTGVYKDVEYTISETNLWYITSGRYKIMYPVFDGVVIVFDSNKTIKNKTLIATKNDLHIKGRPWWILIALLMVLPYVIMSTIAGRLTFIEGVFWYSIVFILCFGLFWGLGFFNNKEILNEIKLEDVGFARKYKAYSSDEVEGRYLLTTAFMERFKNLHTAFGTNKAKCSFCGDKIIFAISTKRNLFEIGNLFTPLNNTKHMKRFFRELTSILEMIDYFKLDEKKRL